MVDQTKLQVCKEKPRIFIVTDISNEPDDAESLVRYLLYANEFTTRGLVACTSTWMRKKVHPEDIEQIVNAYAKVVDNLNSHVHPDNQYPTAGHLLSLVKSGPTVYGKEAFDVPLSPGSSMLIDRLDESDEPLWVLSWGGMNVVASALHHVRKERSEEECAKLCAKLRIYTISDQDDTGLWIRLNFPDIFYICSVHGWGEYSMAAWTGISGDTDRGGPDGEKVTKEWLKQNIQIGPYGAAAYPTPAFIMEGDTPTFFYLIQNGLGSRENPHWGSWGGRYVLTDLGGAARHYGDAKDKVIGRDGRNYITNYGTIWRWRDQYQNDFAARMQWTLSNDRSKANHSPVVIVNDSTPYPEPYILEAEAATEITLDASKTYDPDGDALTFKWFQYKEPSSAQSPIFWLVPDLEIRDAETSVVKITLPPPEKCAVDIRKGQALHKGLAFHVILQVTDDGKPHPMTTYKRVVIQATNIDLKGGTGKEFDTVTEALGHRVRIEAREEAKIDW